MKLTVLLVHVAVVGCMYVPDLFASTLNEQVRCTEAQRSTWMPEEKIRSIFGAEKYLLVKFKVSRTNCYEFYAVAHSGEIIEAYYHPITGALVKENRLQPSAPLAPPAVLPSSNVR